jgi:serine/threonine protein phosphatase PrpC
MKDILERLQAAYMANRWIRIAARAGLLLSAILLLWVSGGFPPWAWRFLFQVIPQIPRLWAVHGLSIVPPLFGLALLAATLLVAWGSLILGSIRLMRGWWQERQELRGFNEDLLKAQYLTEAIQEAQEIPSSNPFPHQPASTTSAASMNASARNQSAAPQMVHRGSIRRPPSENEDIAFAQPHIQVKDRVRTKEVARTESEPRIPTYTRNTVAGSLLHSSGNTKSKKGIYLDIGTGLDAGIKRRGSPNEDSLLAIENFTGLVVAPQPVGLFIVADGMGGHGNGREASQLAIRAMRESVLKALRLGVEEDETLMEVLIEGVHCANHCVYERNQQQQADMGTTLTSTLLWGTSAYVVNVGDSRTYMYRASDGLYQVTKDHSVVARLAERGAITVDEVYTHPKRNEIYRSLGNHPTVEVDSFTVPVGVEDVLLLCSDGLWEMVRDFEIEQIIDACAPYSSRLCGMLVQAALNRGGKDNISVIAVSVREYVM